jgi:hypothetical protein
LVERLPRVQEAAGSNPASPIVSFSDLVSWQLAAPAAVITLVVE